MQNIKVSIVTVCLNSAKTIEQTIQSVINQSYQNIEYIIIDGGSTDGTLEIIKKYERFITYWVSEPDNGIYDAMNKGTNLATGDLIAFMNSDDWYADGAVERAAKMFAETKADVLYGDVVNVDGDVEKRASFDKIALEGLYSLEVIISHQTMFVRRELQKKYMFDPSYRIAADHKLVFALYSQGKVFRYMQGIIAYYRLGGLSSTAFWPYYREIKKIMLELFASNPELSTQYLNTARLGWERLRLIALTDYLYNRIICTDKIISQSDITRGYIIFGAGFMGKRWMIVSQNLGIQIEEIWSNDENQAGKMFYGKRIRLPRNKSRHKNYCILIATPKFESEISIQLLELGFKRNVDFFGYRECLRWAAGIWLKGKKGGEKKSLRRV